MTVDRTTSRAAATTALEPIAIVGLACRFPGAADPEALWQLVLSGVDAIADIPAGRFDVEAFYDPAPGTRGKIVTRQGGFLPEIDRFEPAFFGISPREAACIDPQQRLLLEVAWEAFEDGGVTQERVAGSATGVFVGMWTSEYEGQMFGGSPDVDLYVTTGGGRYAASGRLSYAFDLRGPSLTIDTACSSSLVAVHLACQSLRSGESAMALAGGVNLILEPHITIGYSRSAMLSADARCRFGDARASGYVRSEGVGLVLLKPLARALADRDPIRAVIRGSAVNNDGQGSGLLVAPSPTVQAAMLRRAYQAAGVEPGRVGYVEAHGTGTRVGDPVELAALGEVLGEGRAPGRPCLTGSIKTNIGHTEAASGIAGLIKTVLCLEHRLVPPSLHFSEPNPRIAWDTLPLVIARTPTPWPAEFQPAFAGVNSFGVTGTNAHVVLEAAPATPPSIDPRHDSGVRLLPLSAKTPEALRALAERWVALLERNPVTIGLGDLCYTASGRRTAHTERLGVVGTSRSEMAERLRAYVRGESRPGLVSRRSRATRPRVAFVFPGQGSQWLGMGRALLASEPAFAEALKRCERALAPHVEWSLLDELAADVARSRLERIDVAQPILFALQVALAALWRAWGVEPDVVVGHSMGEVAAAHVAGALSLEAAARVIATRSRLLRGIAGRGAMAMVELSLDEARRALIGREDRVSIAVSNSPRSTVISGDVGALDEVLGELEGRGVFCRRVKVDVASHSPHVDGLRADLLAGLHGLAPGPTEVPFSSTVTGAVQNGPELDPAYWVRNLRDPVLFSSTLARLAAEGVDAFIEVSAHPILVSAVQDALHDAGTVGGLVVASARRDEDERAVMLESLATLWGAGYPIDWARVVPGDHCVVALPAYPWQRERFWFEASRSRRAPSSTTGHPWLTAHVRPAALGPGAELWEGTLAAVDRPCLAAGEVTRLSAAASLEPIVTALALGRSGAFTLTDVELVEELPLDGDVTVQLSLQPASDGGHRLQLFGRATGSAWTTLARAAVPSAPRVDDAIGARHDLDAIRARTEETPVNRIAGWPAHGHRASLGALRLGDGEGLGRLPETPAAERCALHPEALGAGLRVLTATVAGDEHPEGWTVSGVRRIHARASLDRATWVYARERTDEAATTRVGDLWFLDDAGGSILELHGVRFAPSGAIDDLVHGVEWQLRPCSAAGPTRSRARWLIVGEPDELLPALVDRLEAAGDRCVILSAAETLAGRVDDTLGSAGLPFAGCVHLASIGVEPHGSVTAPAAADLGWASALALVQALARGTLARPPRLWLVTRGAQCPTAIDRSASLGAAAVWGLGAVVAYEHPALQATRVDLALDPANLDVAALADELVAGDVEDQVALRNATRYVARLVQRMPVAPRGDAAPVTAEGSYLVTGGLGALGLIAARWLVARGARHLTLLGRRAPADDVARTLDELRALGAEVSVVRGDVTRRDDVERAVAAATARRPLRGVVHAAGALDDGVIANLDRDRFSRVLASKIDGALHLDEATRSAPLDFFVCFSSVIGVLGSPGQANYAAANAGLDAVVARRRAQGRPALSLAWGPWARVGMAAAGRDRGRRLAARGLASLAPEDGIEAFGRLRHTAGTVLVMRFDAARWSRAHAAGARSLLRDLADAESAPVASEGLLGQIGAATPAERRSLLETHLREQIGHVLRVAPARVERDTPLKALGLNSLMSLELRNRLEATLGFTLPATLVWNYPTVAAVAAHLEERLGFAPGETGEAAPSGDDAELDRLLTEIQGLSDEEVRRQLANGGGGARDE